MKICRIDCESVPKSSRSRAAGGSCLSISSFLEMVYDGNKHDLPCVRGMADPSCESLN